MKLLLLKNKKEKFQQEVFEILDQEFKKGSGLLINSGIKKFVIEFHVNGRNDVFFSDQKGLKFYFKDQEEEKIFPINKLNKNLNAYVNELCELLDFFVKNYPVDSDDSIVVTNSEIIYYLKNNNKSKPKINV